MPYFNYLAQDTQGKEVKGSLEAPDLTQAQSKVRQTGLYLVWIKREPKVFSILGFGNVRNLELAVFSHQFAAMISSGVPLLRSLTALAEETTNKSFRAIIQKIQADIENGLSLSAALAKHPKVFSNFFVSLIRTGEAGGVLPAVLNRLAGYLEKEEDLRRKVRSSFAYPTIVLITAILVVTFLLIFIVPVFRAVFKTLRVELPMPTVILIALSNLFVKFWWLLLSVIILGYAGLQIAQRQAKFRLLVDTFKLKFPVFGMLNRKVAVSRFVRTLSTLTGSGLTLNESLNICQDIVGNSVIKNMLILAKKEINQGRQISESLKTGHIFPGIAIQMISVGEESGTLNAMLDKCADFLDEDIDILIRGLVVKLEPMLTFGLAVLIGFIALAIYLPMFDLIKQVNR